MPGGTNVGAYNMKDEVIVEGDQQSTRNRDCDLPPDAPRALNTVFRNVVLTRRQWLEHRWRNEDFDKMHLQNQGHCVKIASYILRADAFTRRNAELKPEAAAFLPRYDAMVSELRTASVAGTGGNIISSLLGFIFGPVYGGMNLATNIGSEIRNRAWDKAMKLQNDNGRFNVEVMMQYLDENGLWLDTMTDYLAEQNHFCATAVLASMPAVSLVPASQPATTGTEAPAEATPTPSTPEHGASNIDSDADHPETYRSHIASEE
jgi:hypothetical protein